MKTTLLLITTMLLAQSLSAQPASHYSGEFPTITGTIKGYDPEKDQGLVVTLSPVIPTPEHQTKKTLTIKPDGSFSYQVAYPFHYQQMWFSIEDHYFGQLLLDQGLNLEIELDPLRENKAHFASEHVRFTGPDGAFNQLVNAYTSFEIPKRSKGQSENTVIIMNRELSPAEKTEKLRAYYEGKKAIIREFLTEQPSPHGWILKNEMLSDMYGEFAVAYWGKEMPDKLLQEIRQHQPLLLSNSSVINYYGYIGSQMLMNTQEETKQIYQEDILPEINIPQERKRLEAYLNMFQQRLDGEEYDKEAYKTEAKYFYDQYPKEVFTGRVKRFISKVESFTDDQADMIRMISGGQDIWERDIYGSKVLPTIKADWAAQIMQQEWEKTRRQIEMVNKKLAAIRIPETGSDLGESVGRLPNGAELFLAKQEKLEDLLGAIRSQYNGKAIILDVWATWCGPCIFDMEQSVDNRKKLEEMGVQVVYLCTASGSNEDKWKKKVTELDVVAPQIFLSPELSKTIMSYFELPGYPSHVFIDKEGQYHRDLIHSLRQIDFDAVKEVIE